MKLRLGNPDLSAPDADERAAAHRTSPRSRFTFCAHESNSSRGTLMRVRSTRPRYRSLTSCSIKCRANVSRMFTDSARSNRVRGVGARD